MTRSSTYSWLEFVTAYIPVLAMYGYMACGGSSWLYVGMSDQPRWNSLPGVNREKDPMLSKLFLMNKYLARSNLTYPKSVSVLEKSF